jgi:hypothetical protein
MWLVIEIFVAAIASIRGWGSLPFLLVLGKFVLDLLLQAATGDSLYGLTQALDVAVGVILVGMAFKGRKRPKKAGKVP